MMKLSCLFNVCFQTVVNIQKDDYIKLAVKPFQILSTLLYTYQLKRHTRLKLENISSHLKVLRGGRMTCMHDKIIRAKNLWICNTCEEEFVLVSDV